MTTNEAENPSFELIGGRLCLDFANTVGSVFQGMRNDRLLTFDALTAWGAAAGALTEAEARRLRREAARRPADAARALADARALREAIFRAVDAARRGRDVGAADLDTLNRFYARALARRRLVAGDRCCRLGWEEDPGALDRMLWPVAQSAVDLLAGDELERIRMCDACEEDGRCTWLFVDETKNHSRRWCSMRDCGNRAKARRHYHRNRA
jgi:predicted RNA-binding Zn ribbon-like protein